MTSLSQLVQSGNILVALGAAYAGGILASLTPCVYPMIPITVGVIGGAKERTWKALFTRAIAYMGGMTLIYSFLGVAAGLSGRLFGSFTNTSGWYLFLGIILTLAALAMLDVFSADPQVWWSRIRKVFGKTQTFAPIPAAEMTFMGAFVLGASSGTIAAPCTTPVLTAILAYIAKTQSIGLGLLLMIAFSLGLSTLLLVVAAFAGALRVLPRSGAWMRAVKTASGLILLAFGEYLIYRAGHGG